MPASLQIDQKRSFSGRNGDVCIDGPVLVWMTFGTSIFMMPFELVERGIGVGERDERRREQPALVVVAPHSAEVAVQRGEVGVEAVEVVLELHLDAGQRREVDRATRCPGRPSP